MNVSEKQVVAINNLPGEKRYQYAIKRIADMEEAWGLYNEGWALATNKNGKQIFPVWPAAEFAQRCAEGDWAEYVPAEIPLDDLLQELLPMLNLQEISLAVAFLPDDFGVVVEPDRLAAELQIEIAKYE